MVQNKVTTPLRADDCFHLGLEAQKSKDYRLSIEWLQMALQAPPGGAGVDKSRILMEIAQTYYLVRIMYVT